jgi:hypothetical protein
MKICAWETETFVREMVSSHDAHMYIDSLVAVCNYPRCHIETTPKVMHMVE